MRVVMSRLLNPMSHTFTTKPMHSLPSQTAPGHFSLFKTFPNYAFLWNIHLYHEYIFLFCPFSLIEFGPFLTLLNRIGRLSGSLFLLKSFPSIRLMNSFLSWCRISAFRRKCRLFIPKMSHNSGLVFRTGFAVYVLS